jgi:hypothetical protein
MLKKLFVVLAAFVIVMPAAFAQEGADTAQVKKTAQEGIEKVAVTTTQEEADKAPAVTLTVEAEVCTEIEERMPVGTADSFPPDVERLYLWSRIMGAEDNISVQHIWSYKGEEKLNLELPVKSASWRTWSYKTILPEWTGKWEVRIIGPDGTVMATIPFTIEEKAEEK